jgi:hypothetical protein
MGFKRFMPAVAIAILCASAAPLAAAPQHQGALVVEQKLADPDPNFVPPPAEASHARDSRRDSELDRALEGVGRAIGQAVLLQQQQVSAKCKGGEPADATTEQRFAWAAACRYTRY